MGEGVRVHGEDRSVEQDPDGSDQDVGAQGQANGVQGDDLGVEDLRQHQIDDEKVETEDKTVGGPIADFVIELVEEGSQEQGRNAKDQADNQMIFPVGGHEDGRYKDASPQEDGDNLTLVVHPAEQELDQQGKQKEKGPAARGDLEQRDTVPRIGVDVFIFLGFGHVIFLAEFARSDEKPVRGNGPDTLY